MNHKPWEIFAITSDRPPRLIGSHHTRAAAETQIGWLRRKTRLTFRLVLQRECPPAQPEGVVSYPSSDSTVTIGAF